VSLCNKYDIKLYLYEELIENQMKSTNITFDHNETKRDAIFTISYTSGTEKDPKGVMLSNENFISAIANILKVAGDFPFNQEDVYISYLPLAHVFDRLGVYGVMSIGARIGFYGGVILKILDDL
jgi:long-chain acyl-CoA synthetase